MSPTGYTEDTLVQKPTAKFMEEQLGWESIVAYNTETFGTNGTLGRTSDREVVLKPRLRNALTKLNPRLPQEAYDRATDQITAPSVGNNPVLANKTKYELVRDGVTVEYTGRDGKKETTRLKVFDFDIAENNDFLVVRELWVQGPLYHRRADIVGFVNGLPLVFMELKAIHKDLRAAYDQNLTAYKYEIPHLFDFNALIVLGNGIEAKIGSISSQYEHFSDWKRLSEDEEGSVDMQKLLLGVFAKENFIDIFENFLLFDSGVGAVRKIIGRNHQFLGVNQAFEAIRNREELDGKLGVFWHTQGAGKSYSMVFLTRKVHRKLGANFTFLICTDRIDLDSQIYKTFAGCGVVDNDADHVRAADSEDLKYLLGQRKSHVFTLIQKFGTGVDPAEPYSDREDIIVITDEAHRTQYGRLALSMWNALPNASYLGFTGTPLFEGDEITRKVFGEYRSTYDFHRAVEDNATVPLYYDARGENLEITTDKLNEKLAEKLEEFETEDADVTERLERELRQDYHIITAEKRLRSIAKDFVAHYSTQWGEGKAMFVAIDKITAVRMHGLVAEEWKAEVERLENEIPTISDDQQELEQSRKIEWMKETQMAVIVSEEQGERDKFRRWDVGIEPHRRLMKQGFATEDGRRIDVESAFKKPEHPFQVVFVCAMWLTGFDVPSLSTLYLDKPLKAHTLMQAIARANRVYEGKNNGLIVDYCGVLKNLRKALSAYVTPDPNSGGGPSPVQSGEELLKELEEAIEETKRFLESIGTSLLAILDSTGFAKNAAILDAKNAINVNDQTRKHFGILARNVFKKFKSCIHLSAINDYQNEYGAIDTLYKSLQEDRDKADVSEIIRELHGVVDESVEAAENPSEDGQLYDISAIDFEKLKAEFAASSHQNTLTQSLREIIEKRLQKLLETNPLKTDFQKHYEDLVAQYNAEKDRAVIEQTFEDLLKLHKSLNEEEHRTAREGMDHETLAVYDLLKKPNLSKSEIKKLKETAAELVAHLKRSKLKAYQWNSKMETRAAVKQEIFDFLYSDETGLAPNAYSDDEVQAYADRVFEHVLLVYGEGIAS